MIHKGNTAKTQYFKLRSTASVAEQSEHHIESESPSTRSSSCTHLLAQDGLNIKVEDFHLASGFLTYLSILFWFF